GLKLSDLYSSNSHGHDPVIKYYPYADEHGEPLFRVCRTASKDFKAQRYESGQYVWGLNGTRRVPYNLPAVIGSKYVLIVEGEKDVETLREHGLIATTNPFGAGKWDDGYNPFFKDKRVVIIADNDETGRKHAHAVAAALLPGAEEVRLVELPDVPEKGDVT